MVWYGNNLFEITEIHNALSYLFIYLFYLNHTQWHSRKHKNTMV